MSWITPLNKDTLIEKLSDLELETTGTVGDLRTRLRDFARANPEHELITAWKTATPTITVDGKSALNVDEITGYKSALNSPTDEKSSPSPNFPADFFNALATKLTDYSKSVDIIRKWNCHFSGKDLYSFLDRVTELKEAYGLDDSHLLQGLPELLRDEPLDWSRNNRRAWESWSDFIDDLKLNFLPIDETDNLDDNIYQRKQKAGENIRTFVTTLQTLIRRRGGYSDKQQLDRIYKNLRPDYQLYFAREDVNTIADLVRKGERFESLTRRKNDEQSHYSNTSRNTHNMAIAASNTPYNRDQCCWKCKQTGHRRRECKNPSKLFCSYCGKEGVLTKNCKCVRPGNATTGGSQGGAQPEN